MRTFLAVEIPEYVRAPIHEFILAQAERELPIKWVAFENLHITLKFLGEIDDKKKNAIMPAITDVCLTQCRFQLRLGGLGCFPTQRQPRVIWIGVDEGDDVLCRIAADVQSRLWEFGFTEEKRFHPHLTIGRVKKPCRVDNILQKSIGTDAFDVDSLVLFKSTLKPDGPIYEGLERFRLA
ncbi:MAG: RNA 2',3'-cyclic phosphodiesterase [candidate division WOR-3 bacterium]|nr:MAG: RNA 2',3'-cyclic phosphodiesterase [candidate division WOR-3 bacterium]